MREPGAFQPGPVKPETLAPARVVRDLGPHQGGAPRHGSKEETITTLARIQHFCSDRKTWLFFVYLI